MLDKTKKTEIVAITAPKIQTASFKLIGTAPFVQARFSQKAKLAMMAKMEAGGTAKGKKVRDARDFDQDCKVKIKNMPGLTPHGRRNQNAESHSMNSLA